jgi:predicted alpha-1,6-mannanase (GH76 family)
VLQGWYDNETGLWDTTGWWNSANCLTILADFASLDQSNLRDTGINLADIIQNTYQQAQLTTVQAEKTIDAAGLPVSNYARVSKRDSIQERGFQNFLDDYYDDEGWWALALIRSHDIGVQGLGDQQYLQAAVVIFEDMQKGNSTCGGIYWSKVNTYTNAIANELYLSVAASLANRMPNKKYYLEIANEQWNWFKNSGLINSDNLINDGLTSNCQNNGQKTWTCTCSKKVPQ